MAKDITVIMRLVDKFGPIADKIAVKTAKMQKTITSTGQSIKKMEHNFVSSGQKMGSVIASLGAGIAAAKIKNALASQVKAFQTWEDGWVGIKKNLSGTDDQFTKLEQTLKRQAKSAIIPIQDYLEIGEAAAAAGYNIENMASTVDAAEKLQAASNLRGAEAVDTLKILINATGDSEKNFSKLASTIVALGQITTGGEKEIAYYTTALTGFASSSKYSSDIILGFGAALKDSGLEAASSGTALERLVALITKGMDTGDFKVFAAIAGESADNFKRMFENKDPEALLKFMSGLKGISEKMGISREGLLEKLGITDVRFARTIKVLGDNVDKVRNKLSTAAKANKENNAALKEYEERAKTLTAILQRLSNKILLVKGSFATTFVNTLKKAEPYITKVLDLFNNLSSEAKSTIIILLGLSAVLLGLIPILAGLAITAGALGIGLLPLIAIMAGIILNIGILIFTITFLRKHWKEAWEKMCEKVDVLGFRIKTFAGNIKAWFLNTWNTITNDFDNFINKITDKMPDFLKEKLGFKTEHTMTNINKDLTDASVLGSQNQALSIQNSLIVEVMAKKGSKVTNITSPDLGGGLTFAAP